VKTCDLIITTGIVALAGMLECTPALAQVRDFDVPSEEASKSIPELARQADVQIIGPGAPLQSVVTPAVTGKYDVVIALEMMLKGTDLKIGRTAEGVITISTPGQKNVCIDRGETMSNKAKFTTTVSWFAMLFASFQCALAQSSDNTQSLETVVVTGVRASMASAMEVKKNASQFMDSIVAEDIGKLPDNTIIDAMEHITGVQVQHTSGAGETNLFLIHGLPDVATTVNDRQIFTTTGRFISLADVPAEMLARVDIKKSTDASDLEGGIAGLINAVFHRPFDFDGMEIGGGFKSVYSTQSDHVDPDASVLFSNRWNSHIGELGLLFDVSYNKRHYQDYDAFDYYEGGSVTDGKGTTATTDDVTAHTPETLGAIVYPGSRERFGMNMSGQWRPNPNTEIWAEAFYSRYRNANEVNFLIGLPNKGTGVSAGTLTTGTDPAGNVIMKSFTASDNFELTSNQAFHDKTDTLQFAVGGTWTGDKVTVSSEFNYTDSKYARRGVIVDTAIFAPFTFYTNYNGSGTPNIIIPAANAADITNASLYHPTQFFDQWTKQYGNEYDWKVDVKYDVGNDYLKSAEFGIRYANRYGKNNAANGGALSCYNTLNGYTAEGSGNASSTQYNQEIAAIKSAACGYVDANTTAWWNVYMTNLFGTSSMEKSHGPFFSGNVAWGVPYWENLNAEWALANTDKLRTAFGQSSGAPAADLSNYFSDREASWSAYAKFNYALQVSGMPLDGNFGIRMVDTDAKMHAYTFSVVGSDTNGNGLIDTYTKTYTPTFTDKELVDWMPSLNAKLGITDDLFLRFATNRTITRPTFAQLNPARNLQSGGLTYQANGSGGNPDLSPVKSNNIDLSLEYYFGKQNNITGAVFYRQIKGYVQQIQSNMTIDNTVYRMSIYQNSGVGYLQGAELSYTQFYDFLPGIWSGLGLQVNGTFIEGRNYDLGLKEKVPYTNVSKYSYNLVGIYENGGFSLRTAYNWRSSFLVSYTLSDSSSIQPSSAYASPYGTLDLSASYQLDDAGLPGMTITFDATNLTNEVYKDAFGKGAYARAYPRDTRTFDQTYELGLRYRM